MERLEKGELVKLQNYESGGWDYGFVEDIDGDRVTVYWFDWESTTVEDTGLVKV